jgi:hypothetical protein
MLNHPAHTNKFIVHPRPGTEAPRHSSRMVQIDHVLDGRGPYSCSLSVGLEKY